MGYFNYHAKAKKLINEGKLKNYFFTENYNGISPALILVFNDDKHPVIPIREYRWNEYLPLLGLKQQKKQQELILTIIKSYSIKKYFKKLLFYNCKI